MPRTPIDGNHVLYHYLQKELQHQDYWLFQMMVARLVAGLGIWFSPRTYQAFPVLLPFAVRDPRVRGDALRNLPDQWGAPTSDGYFRDDNSLIKGLPKSLTIKSPSALYDGRSIGNGFVASHVWRELTPHAGEVGLASRHPLTYSFVPNLVWIPKQVAKLTDREGSFTQQYLQAVSVSLYRDVPVASSLRRHVDEAWALLPDPLISELGVPSIESLSFFGHDQGFVGRRRKTLSTVTSAMQARAENNEVTAKVVSSRYTQGIARLQPQKALQLLQFLEDYLNALERET